LLVDGDGKQKTRYAGARTLRAVDLARQAGVSPQQIRNYLDEGILPSVTRSPAGYRIFTVRHAQALSVARQLALGHGWPRTRAIMQAINQHRPDDARAIIDHSYAELARERTDLADILAAVNTLAVEPSNAAPTIRGQITIGEVARRVGVRRSALRVWEDQGLLRPRREERTEYRIYTAADLRDAHIVALLRQGGYRHPAIRAILDEIRTTGNTERARAALTQREAEINERGRRRLAASAVLQDYLDVRNQE